MHPIMRLVLEAAMLKPADGGSLRMWHEAATEDSVVEARAKPDMLWTHARDNSPCSLGACFSLELKRWDEAQSSVGCAQAGNYCRRIVALRAQGGLDHHEHIHRRVEWH